MSHVENTILSSVLAARRAEDLDTVSTLEWSARKATAGAPHTLHDGPRQFARRRHAAGAARQAAGPSASVCTTQWHPPPESVCESGGAVRWRGAAEGGEGVGDGWASAGGGSGRTSESSSGSPSSSSSRSSRSSSRSRTSKGRRRRGRWLAGGGAKRTG